MAAPNSIQERTEEIQSLIAADNVPQAIKLLMDFVRDFTADKENVQEVIVISSNYHRLEKIERRGSIPYEQIEQNRSKLLYQILGLIDSIENELMLNISAG